VMARALLALLLLCGCGDDDGGGPTSGPCVDGAAGIEVHVTVTCTTLSPCAFTDPEIRINFPVAGLVTFDLPLESFDSENRATARLAYPDNAGTGQAIVAFFADVSATAHIDGEAMFASYPTQCVMVDLAAMDTIQ